MTTITTILLWPFVALALLISFNSLLACFLAWDFIREIRDEEKRLKEEDEFFERKRKPVDIEERGEIIGYAVDHDGTRKPLYGKPKYDEKY